MSIRKPREMEKKAVVEVQFNWIFVLIAGALIMVFFITIIEKQKSASDKKIAVNILNSMDKIISGQKTSENRQDVIGMFEVEFLYSCDGCDCEFSLSGMSKSKGNLIVFAPGRMRSDRLLTWTQYWDMPFRVNNFVYFTIPEIKYIFVSLDSNIKERFITEEFTDNMPVNMSKEVLASLNDISYKGEQKIRLIYFTEDDSVPPVPNNLKGEPDTIISALTIQILPGISFDNWYKGGSVLRFYKKQGDAFVPDKGEDDLTNEFPVLGTPTAYGAIYSDTFQNFKCNMDDAITRLGLVSEVYKAKIKKLEDDIPAKVPPYCAGSYSTGYLNRYQIAAGDLYGPDAESVVTNLYQGINGIEVFNDGAITLSCPRIY